MKGLEQSGRQRMGAEVREVLRDWKAVSAAGDQTKGTLPVRVVRGAAILEKSLTNRR
jgi:hypothetical protein